MCIRDRSKAFEEILETAEKDFRELLKIPDNYKVLFLSGGAHHQFAAVPMNLMKNGVADYIVTGQWAKKAYAEAQKYGTANKIASSEDQDVYKRQLYNTVPYFLLRISTLHHKSSTFPPIICQRC